MLRATIRPTETRQVDVSADSLEGIQAKLESAGPDGFELVSVPVSMEKVSTTITATGTFVRRDETQVIVAESMSELCALVPEGWQMLHVIRE